MTADGESALNPAGVRERLSSGLAGRYEVERELGQGGMATVYLAADVRHGRHVALKVLKPEIAAAVGSERFLNEIEVTARLNHPHILPLLDSGNVDGCLFYVMPHVAGESLRERLDRERQLSVEDAVRIMQEVADGLSHAHSLGFVHRDIKPDNILLESGHAIVADFGIARAISSVGQERLTETGIAVGTPAYMSPEQAGADQVIDGRSDLYSLACVGYEMLAGEPPFSGPTAQAIVSRHLLEKPPSLEIVRPSVPEGALAAINKALEKTPADRFPTAAAFSAALAAQGGTKRRHRPKGTLRWLAATAAVLTTAATVAILRRSAPVALDLNRIVVFPLVTADAELTDLGMGWRAALAIEEALEHAEPLKSLDGWGRLGSDVRSDPRLLTAAMALDVGTDRRAGYYLDGAIRSNGDSVAVVVRLHDVGADSLVMQETATGVAGVDVVEVLAVRALATLLPRWIDPAREIDFSPFLERDPGAVALAIQGDREYRRSRFLSALAFYRRAVAADSSLAFAAVKGAQAASWNERLDEAGEFIRVATAHEQLLPAKYRDLVRGIASYLDGAADRAVAALEAALRSDPEWSEASMALGEVYYHLLPARHPLDSLAAAAFTAAAADRDFSPPLVHLTEIALRKGDVVYATEILARLRGVELDAAIGQRLSVMVDCVAAGADRYSWDATVRRDPSTALQAAIALSAAAALPGCAASGLRAVLGAGEVSSSYRWGAVQALQGLLLAQGRDDEALAVLDTAIASGLRGPYSLYVFDALDNPVFATRAGEAEELARSAKGPYYEGARLESRWLLALWQLRRGNWDIADSIQRSLDASAEFSQDRMERLVADALSAHLAVADGDTAGAIAVLGELRAVGSRQELDWGLAAPLPVEKYLLAALLMERGQYRDALNVATVFDHPQPVMYLAYLRASLLLRLRAAEELHDVRLVRNYRDRLGALGQGASPTNE